MPTLAPLFARLASVFAFIALLAGLWPRPLSASDTPQPPAGLFRETSYEDACQASGSEKKPTLILFDGDWAKDRNKLFSKTLASPKVQKLIREKMVACRLDVIDQAEIAKKHSISDVPTLILLNPEGHEISRWTGAPKPTPFAEELDALLSGKSRLLYKQTTLKSSDLPARNKLAAALITEGHYEQARTELLWLYHTGIGPGTMVRKKLSTKQVVDNLHYLSIQHPPSRELISQLLEQERLRVTRSPGSIIAAQKLATLMQTQSDFATNLALYESLPAGAAREHIKVNFIIRAYVRQRAFDKAADLLPIKQALAEADEKDEMSSVQRGIVRTALLPFGGTYFSTKIIHHVQEKALNRRVFFYEIYAGAGRTDEARQIALAILEWDRLEKAPDALRAATRKSCGEKADAFLQALALPPLAEPKK